MRREGDECEIAFITFSVLLWYRLQMRFELAIGELLLFSSCVDLCLLVFNLCVTFTFLFL